MVAGKAWKSLAKRDDAMAKSDRKTGGVETKGGANDAMRRAQEVIICPFVYFIHLSIDPFIHSSIHPFIHSSIHPFIHRVLTREEKNYLNLSSRHNSYQKMLLTFQVLLNNWQRNIEERDFYKNGAYSTIYSRFIFHFRTFFIIQHICPFCSTMYPFCVPLLLFNLHYLLKH